MPSEQQSCVDMAEFLAGYDEFGPMSADVHSHVGNCLRCQAELSGFRKLRRSMLGLADVWVAVDPSLEHRILFALDGVDDRADHRLAMATAVTLGGLAAAAGVIVVASRQIRSLRMVV